MITIEEGLLYHLQHNTGLVALISTRVYPTRIAQDAVLPCMTFQRVSTPRIITHDTSGSTGTAHPRFSFDAWGETQKSVKAITDALRAAINGYHSTMGATDPVTVQAALIDGETIEYDTDTELWHSRSEYIIWHLE